MSGPVSGDDRRRLTEALARTERRAARPRRALLAHPVRALRPLLHHRGDPVEVSCRLFTGRRLRVVLPEIVGVELYRHGVIEAGITRVLLERLRPGMVVIDVGAQYGYHSLVAAELVRPGGTVVAVEPSRDAFRLLRANVAGLAEVRPLQVALHDAPGHRALQDFGPRHSALNTVAAAARVPPAARRPLQARTYEVPCTTLDHLLAELGLVPDVVKLDAEGSELAILHGMARVLAEAAPLVVLETGDYEGMASPPTSASIDLLEGHGYRCLEHGPDGLRPHRRRDAYGYDNLFFVKGAADGGDGDGGGAGKR